MTLFHKAEITCPYCASGEDVVVWDRIDVAEDPDLKERLLRKEVQQHICQNCGEDFILALPLLYVDEAKQMQVYYCPHFADALKEWEASGGHTSQENLPHGVAEELARLFPDVPARARLRLEPTYNGLIEQIHLREQGLDDRVMAVVKLALSSRYLTEEEILFDEMFFLSLSDKTLLFEVLEHDKGWHTLETDPELYLNALAILETRLPPDNHWQLVDRAFARQLIS